MSAIRELAISEYLPQKDISRFPTPINVNLATNSIRTIIDFGSGMGDHALAMASENPDTHVVAMDVHTAGITNVLIRAHDADISNISVHLGDGIDVLRDILAPNSISEVHVLFPDPWPKARQQKRRVIQPAFLNLVDRVLEPKGVFRFVTDDDGYADEAEEIIAGRANWIAMNDTWQVPLTNYHARALKLGHKIHGIYRQKI